MPASRTSPQAGARIPGPPHAARGSVLVTGAAGFIGANLVNHLLAHTRDAVVGYDALTYAGDKTRLALALQNPRFTFVHANVCDADALAAVFASRDVRAVLHLAAESHVDRSIAGPDAFIETNVTGTLRLLEAARDAWQSAPERRPAPRFVHVSTDEVYGDLAPGAPAFTADSPYNPSSPYAASKAASDHLVRAWHRTYGLPAIVTHCSNNHGPWQHPEKLIPHMVKAALRGAPLPVYGDGAQVRDWLHVADHCAALCAVLDRGVPGSTYCFGGDAERDNLSVVRAIADAADVHRGLPAGTTRAQIMHVRDRPGHDRRYAVDAHASRAALGLPAPRGFDMAFADTLAWMFAHQDWLCAQR